MKIILKYILTNVKERKSRTFVMLLSILLSAMLLFVSLSIGVSYESAQRKMARGMAGSATVSVQSVEGGIHADDIPALPDIQAKAGIVEGTSLYHENGYYETVDLLAAGMEALNQINKPRLIGGGEVTAFSGNQIILPDRFTSKYGIEKGDTVTLQINGSPVGFEVAEIAAYDTVFLRHTRGSTALLPLETIKEVLGREDGYSEILIEPAPNSTTGNLISELKNALDNGKYRVSEVVNEAQIAADARQKSMPFFLISFFSLTMSIFIIYSSYKVITLDRLINYIQKRRTIAMYKSIGLSNRQNRKMTLIEGFSSGLIGAVIAIVVSYMEIQTIFLVAGPKISMTPELDIWTFLVAGTLGIIVTLLGSIVPIFKSRKMKLVEEIKFE